MITQKLPSAAKEWSGRTARFDHIDDTYDTGGELSGENTKACLAAFLDGFSDFSNLKSKGRRLYTSPLNHSALKHNDLLYSCSFCDKSTAILRKCKRCGKARCTYLGLIVD